jgi:hypothetical protein
MSPLPLSRRERCLLWPLALLLLAAVLGPVIRDAGFAGAPFADGHAWGALPNAMDVLSNLPFAVAGLWGLWRVRRARQHAPDAALDGARMFFAGLILTALGSTWYHLQPDGLRLVADRVGMAVAFAGMIGLAISERVSPRAGPLAAWFMLAAGWLAAAIGHATGNVLPWALVQFGGMALIVGLAFVKPVQRAIGLQLGAVIFLYALAKLFEVADHGIFDATHHLISGHSLKHLTAALAAWPVLHALKAIKHNPGLITIRFSERVFE